MFYFFDLLFYIILDIGEMTDLIYPPIFTKANQLHNHLNKNVKENREDFGIIVARFVKMIHEGNEVLTVQLIPFSPKIQK